MSYKFQVGSAALSGNVLQKLGTAGNSQMIYQDDAGNTRLIIKAGSKGSISGSGGLEFTTGSFSSMSSSNTVKAHGAISAGKNKIVLAADGGLKFAHVDANWTNAGITVADLGSITTVDINGGTADNVVIGGSTQAAASFTTLSASSTLQVGGTVQLDGVADATFAAADRVYFRDADGSGLVKSDTWDGLMEVAAGTVQTTGIENTSGVLSLAIHSLNAEVIATGDKIAFADAGDNGLHSETVDDLFTKGPALTTEAAITVADDYLLFLDGGASGDAKKEKWADIASAIAGNGITATNGVLSAETAAAPNELAHGETMTEALNYTTGSNSVSVYLPHTSLTLGDTVRLKVQALGNGKVVNVSSKAGGGTTIDGLSSIAVQSQYGAVTFVYAVSGSWFII